MGSAVLSQVNSWVGVTAALVGAIVAAPSGVRLLLPELQAWLVSLRQRIRSWLPSRRSDQTLHVPFVGGTANVFLPRLTAEARGRVWSRTAPVDEQIETLREWINELVRRVARLEQDGRRELTNVRDELARVERSLASDVTSLRHRAERDTHESARIDARALPVMGVGVVLAGVPDQVASIPWHLGWLLPICAMWLTATAVAGAVRDHRASRYVKRSPIAASSGPEGPDE
jgi:hypothetical protein